MHEWRIQQGLGFAFAWADFQSTGPASVSGSTRMAIDAAAEIEKICTEVRQQVGVVLRRRGLVIAMSGGIDSSVCAALATRALGSSRVLGLALPEDESDPLSLRLARGLAEHLGIQLIVENIGPMLRSCGCYERRDAAVRRVIPEFGPGWRFKLTIANDQLERDRLNITFVEVRSPEGAMRRERLPAPEYREIVAATNFKQRVRKMMEYFHADRLHYAVVGTPNRLEYDQGFFVKGGDGLADVKPIAHLFKTQVYELARHLNLPADIIQRVPTTDTFSLPQTQEEFFFALPIELLDQLLEARDRDVDTSVLAAELGLEEAQVLRAFRDIDRKRGTTRYLHQPPLLVQPITIPV